ncbi:peptidoglycan-binding domain-containing protein [Profundibacterium mesophilum]|uniref:Peptidoglycan-binding domain 1 n=1 Tax=Profundibacterium mesophilum KAUST100406-0324 TaxID=1037889 RepID=A0A921NQ30_9RHOB|nr:peptidoglycan-binding protein [Profundibacterium mesophilum]KAF0676596.1 Peptidoglycan-binding domain 1 [Profundibacterium mesophilum KAUST100406-0324]
MASTRLAGWLLTTALCTIAAPLAAADIGLVLGNGDYRRGTDPAGAERVLGAVDRLEDAGVDVISGRNADHDRLRRALSEFEQMAPEADGLLVVLSGRFVHSSTETWFLPVDTQAETLSELSREALALSSVMAMLEKAPRRAVLALAASDETETELGPYLRSGPGRIEAAQGVTVITGRPDALEGVLRDTLAVPGASIPARLRNERSVRAYGFVPEDHAFLPRGAERERDSALAEVLRRREAERDREAAERRRQEDLRERERAAAEQLAREREAASAAEKARRDRRDDGLWAETVQRNTEAAYAAYLEAFPQGRRADAARTRLDEIRNGPANDEARLNLGRDARRQIQRDLSLLGYDTRGIDGIFGQGTRQAIRAWQGDRNFGQTGYLDVRLIRQLEAQAEARAAELEAESRKRRDELDRADAAYWKKLGSGNNELGIRTYLERYPDGRYAEVGRENLVELERRRVQQADPGDRSTWREARQTNTRRAYQGYLSRYPQGSFTDQAVEAIKELDRQPDPAIAQAEAAEAALNMAPLAKRLVEQRLDALGHAPGEIDGVFDDRTRRALRRYQDEARLPVTGYMTQDTVVRLLADTVRGILR